MARNDDNRTREPPQSGIQPIYVAIPEGSEGGIDLVELWLALWAGKWMIVGVTFLFTVLGIVYSLSITPVYRAEIVLAPVSQYPSAGLGNLSGLASLAGINLDTGGDNNHSLAVLESKNFTAEFIKDRELLPILFQDEWDAANARWISNDPEAQRDFRDGVRVFTENVRTISEDPQTGLITLAIEWTNPETAAVWATEMVKKINERTRQQDIAESQRKLDYLNEQLSNANLVELRLAISRVIEEQISAMMLAQSQMEYAFEVIDPAVVPKQRVRPKRTIIVIVAAFLGGFIGVFILLVRVAIRRLQVRAASESAEFPPSDSR